MNGTKQIATRITNAEQAFINAVMEQFGKTEAEANKVLSVYRKAKAVKLDPVMGQFVLAHGSLWELSTINFALTK